MGKNEMKKTYSLNHHHDKLEVEIDGSNIIMTNDSGNIIISVMILFDLMTILSDIMEHVLIEDYRRKNRENND
jgi:hypothetical protein